MKFFQSPIVYTVSLIGGCMGIIGNAIDGNGQAVIWACIATFMLIMWVTEKG